MTLLRRLLTPSLADCLFAAILAWLVVFTISGETAGLFNDSDTAAHIRTGDYVRQNGVPATDIYSFTRAGQPWYAWEWLAGVIWSWLHQAGGLRGVGTFAAVTLALSTLVVLRHMLWRGANFLAAILALHVLVAVSSLHYLARPHVFTLLFFPVALWTLDADRRGPSRRVWLLVPLTALWANLHGAFAAWIGTVAVLAAGYALARAWAPAKRYALLAAGCLAASGLNPYGFRVHAHIVDYMRQKWIVELVNEFQSVRFDQAVGRYFEVLLVLGVMLAAKYLADRRFPAALLILAWTHLALQSARHLPLYAIVVLPPLAEEASALWNRWTAKAPAASLAAIFARIARDHTPHLRRVSLWSAAAVVAVACTPLPWPRDFPAAKYPVNLTSRNRERLASARVFAPDFWSSYLIYRNYPRQRIFVDGRSDFFGKEIFEEYLRALRGYNGWDEVLNKHQVELILAPCSTALVSVARRDAHWRLIDQDGLACLAERVRE